MRNMSYFSYQAHADKVSNWLPAPAEEFSLFIRAYWPLPPIQEGLWTPPPVVPV
jgi:hypothetical protein